MPHDIPDAAELEVITTDHGALMLKASEAELYRAVTALPGGMSREDAEPENVAVAESLEALGRLRANALEAIGREQRRPVPLDIVRHNLRDRLAERVANLAEAEQHVDPFAAEAVNNLAAAYARLGGDLELAAPEPPSVAVDIPKVVAAAWNAANDAGTTTQAADHVADAVRDALQPERQLTRELGAEAAL